MTIARERELGVEEERVTPQSFPWVVAEHNERFRFAASLAAGAVVVDCACGDGMGSAVILDASPRSLVAIDLSVQAAALARTRLPASAKAAVCVAQATELPIANESVDLVVSLETIEHLNDDIRFLKEVRRILTPDGTFVCSTPNRSVTHPGAPRSVIPMNRFHDHEYSVDEFRALLGREFTTVELFGQNGQQRLQSRWFAVLSKALPFRVVARMNQMLKLRRYLWYDPRVARVTTMTDDREYEYLVARCTNLHASSAPFTGDDNRR